MTNSEKLTKAFTDRYTQENHPDSLPQELAEQLQKELAYKGTGPVYAAYGRWKKKAFLPKPKTPEGIKRVKRRNPDTGITEELTIFRVDGDTAWVR